MNDVWQIHSDNLFGMENRAEVIPAVPKVQHSVSCWVLLCTVRIRHNWGGQLINGDCPGKDVNWIAVWLIQKHFWGEILERSNLQQSPQTHSTGDLCHTFQLCNSLTKGACMSSRHCNFPNRSGTLVQNLTWTYTNFRICWKRLCLCNQSGVFWPCECGKHHLCLCVPQCWLELLWFWE